MEPATIAVLVFTAAFFGLCVWVEVNSRRRKKAQVLEDPVEEISPAEELPEIGDVQRRRRRLRR